MLRNLLYNCYAPISNKEWLLNVEKLNSLSSIFNGRKIVIIRQDEGLVPTSLVVKAFTFEADFIELANDAKLQETAGFVNTLRRLRSLRPDEITFYAHTKGVSHGKADHRLHPVRVWRNTMYEQCLSDPDKIDKLLQTYACCGCFRNNDANVGWHFAGTFWWVNHEKLFSKQWETIRPSPYGVENYLPLHFSREEGYCLYGADNYSLYTAPWPFVCKNGHVFKNASGPWRSHGHWPLHARCPVCKRRARPVENPRGYSTQPPGLK